MYKKYNVKDKEEAYFLYKNMIRSKTVPCAEFEIYDRILRLDCQLGSCQSKILLEIKEYFEEFKEVYAKDVIDFVLKYLK